jgi:hypothetical protein
MLDISSLLTAGPAPADFSTIVCYRDLAFGLIAFPHKTCILLGEREVWMQVPSWFTALAFLAVAAAEWLILRLIGNAIRSGYRRWKAHQCAAAAG